MKAEDMKPLLVACRCGWQGEDRQLISHKFNGAKYCPACARLFKAVPDTSTVRQGERHG